MKKNKLTTAVVAGLAGVAGMSNAAVHLSDEGVGQVLIFPYYTVNNGLVTGYSIVNTTSDSKAVKVRFLEGDHSLEVLDFNVYMSPFDVWTGGLISVESTIDNGELDHNGEPSGAHISFDTTCAPGLSKGGQEFLPYEIELDLADTNKSMERATQGHFEVLEMGTLTDGGLYDTAADHGNDGIPADCGAFEEAWVGNGDWVVDPSFEIEDVTGGLFGSASLVNVAEGLAMTYDAVAIDDFWTLNAGNHTDPGSLAPSLSEADLLSSVFVDGDAEFSIWPSGFESVSALFMRKSIYNEYAFDSGIAAKSEWVVTFPTKNFHVSPDPAVQPFVNSWNGLTACEDVLITIWDREEQVDGPGDLLISPQPPQGSSPQICQEANVIQFLAPGEAAGGASEILGSTNLTTISGVQVPHATENGWARMTFNGTEVNNVLYDHIMVPDLGTAFEGLPVTGFMVQQYTNAQAQPGLLAQYAGLFQHKGDILVSVLGP